MFLNRQSGLLWAKLIVEAAVGKSIPRPPHEGTPEKRYDFVGTL